MRTFAIVFVMLCFSTSLPAQYFEAYIDGDQAQSCTGTGSIATAQAVFTLDQNDNSLEWDLVFPEFSSPALKTEFHIGAECVESDFVWEFGVGDYQSGRIQNLTAQQIDDILAGLLFLNITTENFPDGEIRGHAYLIIDDNNARRGDCNSDGLFDIADVIYGLSKLFGEPSLPASCEANCDANDDNLLNIADPITMLSFLFSGGAALPAPFPDCGFNNSTLDCMYGCI